jgi:hypothetical protein
VLFLFALSFAELFLDILSSYCASVAVHSQKIILIAYLGSNSDMFLC